MDAAWSSAFRRPRERLPDAHYTTVPRVFLTAEWRSLAFLNFAIDPAILAPFVPRGTELDDWQGTTFVSVVGFLFLRTRVRGVAVPLHQDFPEVNLRFYVRRRAAEGWRRGVVFIKEIVPKPMITAVARWFYNENYATHRMRHEVVLHPQNGGTARYEWQAMRQWQRLQASASGAARPLTPGSEEEFITEHYWGYARQRDGRTKEYEVRHPPWRVWRAEEARLQVDVECVYGPEFADALGVPPRSAFIADGSSVKVFNGARLP